MCLGLFPFGESDRGEMEFGLRFPGELTRGGDGIESGRLFRNPGREEHDKEELRLLAFSPLSYFSHKIYINVFKLKFKYMKETTKGNIALI